MPASQTRFEAIGTLWTIDVNNELPDKDWQDLLKVVRARIDAFDKNYSRFRADSLVTKMSNKAGSYVMPSDGFELFDFYEKLYLATASLATPLIGRLMSDAGYDADYSLMPKALTKPPRWEDVLEFSRQEIKLKQPVLLDFGAAGKGYLVDIVGDLLKGVGITEFVINAGGDILHHSASGQAAAVGLENPADPSEAIGVTELNNKSLCASAGSRRKWDKFNHLINPQTLQSPKDILATWVVASSAMVADGLATALFFCPPKQLEEFDFAYAILGSDMALTYSKDFPVKLFKK